MGAPPRESPILLRGWGSAGSSFNIDMMFDLFAGSGARIGGWTNPDAGTELERGGSTGGEAVNDNFATAGERRLVVWKREVGKCSIRRGKLGDSAR